MRILLSTCLVLSLTSSLYAGQLVWPVSATITGDFGPRSSPCSGCSTYHNGVDLGCSSGTYLGAPGNGTVASYAYDSCGGNIMRITYGGGYDSRFMHLSGSVAGTGASVTRNQNVARSGNTGSCTTGAHLHFEVRRDGVAQSIPGSVGSWVTRNNVIPKDFSGLPDLNARKGPSMFYRTGDSSMNIYRWVSTGSAFSSITQTGIASGYSLDQIGQHMAAADVNGDGEDDNVVAYQYPDGTMRLHVFLNGSAYQGAAGWFQSGAFDMAMVNGRMVGGDFDGNGKGDVAMLYDIGSGVRIFRFLSNGSSFSYDSAEISTGYSLEQVADNIAASDVNGDRKTDIVAAYQYSDGTMRLHVFLNGNSYAGAAGWFQSGQFNMAMVNGRMVGGDFDGNGKGDVAMMYDNGGGVTLFRFLSNGSSFSCDSATISSGYSAEAIGKNVAAGDCNGDGKADMVAAYQYADGTFRYHVFINGNSYAGPSGWYQSGSFSLANVAGRMTMGKWQ